MGSNQGNRKEFLKRTIAMVHQLVGSVSKCSAIYETEAWGFESDQTFLNQAIEISTLLPPGKLLNTCLKIESKLGRIRRTTSNNRVIDIDILLYGNKIVRQKKCTIPHPRLHLRNFTLVPLQEIAPEVKHPEFGLTISELLKLSTDNLKVKNIETNSCTT